MSDYLTADELADLINCRPNQKALMAKWLSERRWKFVLDRNDVPRVARAYARKKLGTDDEPIAREYATGPNLEVRHA